MNATWEIPYPHGATANHMYAHTGPVRLTDDTRAWKDMIVLAMRQKPRERVLMGVYLAADITAFMPDLRKRDLDNLVKVLLDTIATEVGFNDTRIVDITLHKRWRKGPPGIVVTVSEAQYQGEVQ